MSHGFAYVIFKYRKYMELEVQQPPQSPRTEIVSQQSAPLKGDSTYLPIQESIEKTIEQLKQQRNQDISEALTSALRKHREEILKMLDSRTTDRLKPLLEDLTKAKKDIEMLEKDNTALAEAIGNVSRNHKSFITTTNQERKWFGLAFIGTALGLSLNFIMFAYLWHHTHK